jgi:hypothetical protein
MSKIWAQAAPTGGVKWIHQAVQRRDSFALSSYYRTFSQTRPTLGTGSPLRRPRSRSESLNRRCSAISQIVATVPIACFLLRKCPGFDQRHWTIRRAALCQQAAHDRPEVLQRHQDDQNIGRARKLAPPNLAARGLMSSHKRNTGGKRTVSHRNTGVGRHPDRRADAGDDLEENVGRAQRLRFFTAAAEDKWIAAFEPDNAFALARPTNELLLDRSLIAGAAAGDLADIKTISALAETKSSSSRLSSSS